MNILEKEGLKGYETAQLRDFNKEFEMRCKYWQG
jgi:hypothetical protein